VLAINGVVRIHELRLSKKKKENTALKYEGGVEGGDLFWNRDSGGGKGSNSQKVPK